MTGKTLLLGDEALALGALHAGLSGVFAYPGTPSTEITEYIQSHPLARSRGLHCDWSANEKTAMESALGMSYSGKRALVCMKHVGMNVCADAFVNSAITGANGGLVVVACDDPSQHSSQNEQDSRFYADFAMVPCFEPSDQQEAYDMVREAFEYSESRHIPVLMRLTTRMAHSRAVVSTGEIRDENRLQFPAPERASDWVTLPANAKKRVARLAEELKDFGKDSENSGDNVFLDGKDRSLGIIACGIAYNYLMENCPDGCPYPVLKVTRYPFPKKQAREMAAMCRRIIVMEEGQPLIEERLGGLLYDKDNASTVISGRLDGTLPRTGELTPDCVRAALGLAPLAVYGASEVTVPRPPALCQGCGHRDFYTALNVVLERHEPQARVFSDIGCYTLGYLPPFKAFHTCVEMGASITMAIGASCSGVWPAVAVIGDSTFTHSGMTGLLDAVNAKADIVVCISDNLTTGMTGGQDSAGTGKLEQICLGLGVEPEHVRTIVPLPKNWADMEKVIGEEIGYHGVSVIICRRECIQTARRHAAAASKK